MANTHMSKPKRLTVNPRHHSYSKAQYLKHTFRPLKPWIDIRIFQHCPLPVPLHRKPTVPAQYRA